MMPPPSRRTAVVLMAASGFAGLGYQVVWTQQGALWLGQEPAAVLAVVGAFFGGLAAGAFVLGPRIDRSRRPGRWYAACELAIGVWGAVLAFLLGPITRAMLDLIGAQPSAAWQWSVAFGGTFVLLLPATAAMGATLPAMERVLAPRRGAGGGIAILYAGNTLGAVAGVLATAFWLVPAFGLATTAVLCMGLNGLCAALALRSFPGEAPRPPAAAAAASGARGVLFVLATTGLLGIGYEVLVVRATSQVAENTVYTFALLLAVYLVGTALGAAAYDRWRPGAAQHARWRDGLLCALAASCLLGLLALAAAPALKPAVARALGGGFGAALAAEAAIAVAAFLLPATLMGALFSHLCTGASRQGIALGRSLGANTLGAALAPALFGVLAVPATGSGLAMILVAAGYLLLAAPRASISFWATASGAAALAAWGPTLRVVDVPPGGRVIDYREGPMAAVSVVEDAGGVARLHIDNRQQEGSSATRFADARQALLPVLLHPAPGRALFLGLGTGVTAASAARDPRLEVDAVELLPDVIEASARFRRPIEGLDPNPRLRLVAADARRFVRTTANRYDVVVADNFHPARSGSGSLYTVEHFEAVRSRLAPGGLFCQWLPLHQLDFPTLRGIVGTFLAAYPQAVALLATNSLETPVVGLLARADGGRFDPGLVRARLAGADFAREHDGFGLEDELALLGSFVAGPASLARFAGGAPLNTDDRPWIAYRAPRATYAPDSLPRDRLVALLHELDIRPGDVVTEATDAAWAARLAAYWRARDRFIEAGRAVEAVPDVRRMLGQVRDPLLAVLRTSPDFRPAYDPLLRMAAALAREDAEAARALLQQLREVQPSRPEAAAALRDITPGRP